jgi:hypothetical protein
MSDTPTAPAGWFNDPTTPGIQRYFDGTQWTQQTQPIPRPASAIGDGGWVGLVAAGLAFIGSFLAWVKFTTIFGTIEVAGFDGDGKITAGAAALSGFLTYSGFKQRERSAFIWAGLIALIGLAVSIYDYSKVNDKIGAVGSDVARGSVGIGLYLCIVGFLVSMFSAFGFGARFRGNQPS